MVKLLSHFLKLSHNIEIFISLMYINIFLLYFGVISNEVELFLLSTLILVLVVFSSVISNFLEIGLKTDEGNYYNSLFDKVEIPFIKYTILIVAGVSSLFLTMSVVEFVSNYVINIILIYFTLEVLFDLSIFNLQNNILKIFLRTLFFTFGIGYIITASQIPNLIVLSSSLLTINFDSFTIINITILPIFMLMINMSVTNFLDSSSNEALHVYAGNIKNILYYILVFSIIPLITFSVIPISAVLLFIIGYIIKQVIDLFNYKYGFEYASMAFVIAILLFIGILI